MKKYSLPLQLAIVGIASFCSLWLNKIGLYTIFGFELPAKVNFWTNVILYTIPIIVAAPLFALFFNTRLGLGLRRITRRIWDFVRLINLSRRTGLKYIFIPSERGSFHYKELIKTALARAQNIDITLISAFTMYHEDEEFILDGITEALKYKCKVRILLWDCKSEDFIKRARWFIPILKRRNREKFSNCTVETYTKKCERISKELADIPDIECRLYKETPAWRIHMTDDFVFFSSYLDKVEGNQTTVLGFKKMSNFNLYNTFSCYFDNMWRKAQIIGPDGRLVRRFDVELDTDYKRIKPSLDSEYSTCRCLNISTKGILLPITIPKGTALDLKIKLSSEKEIAIRGTAVWSLRNSNTGIEFDREIKIS